MQLPLFHPKYWPSWILFGFLWLIVQLPLAAQLRVGQVFGLILYRFAHHRRHVTTINLRVCFPQLSEQALNALVKKTIISNATGFIETAFSWWASDARIDALMEIRGFPLIEDALEAGHGVLLLGGHFTTLDLGGRMMSRRTKVDVIYRQNKNPVFDYFIVKNRQKFYEHVIERSNARQIIKSLKQGRMVWYAADQDYGRKHSVFAPFFGIDAASITATRRIAKSCGSSILFFSHFRKHDNSAYILDVSAPLTGYPSDDEIADATAVNTVLENAIKLHPDQYMWTHRRFKTRPDGNKNFYASGYREYLPAAQEKSS